MKTICSRFASTLLIITEYQGVTNRLFSALTREFAIDVIPTNKITKMTE